MESGQRKDHGPVARNLSAVAQNDFAQQQMGAISQGPGLLYVCLYTYNHVLVELCETTVCSLSLVAINCITVSETHLQRHDVETTYELCSPAISVPINRSSTQLTAIRKS